MPLRWRRGQQAHGIACLGPFQPDPECDLEMPMPLSVVTRQAQEQRMLYPNTVFRQEVTVLTERACIVLDNCQLKVIPFQ